MILKWNFAVIISIFLLMCLSCATTYDYPTANFSTTWINSVSAPHSVNFTDGSRVRAILLRGTFSSKYACGFFCNGICDGYLFAVFIVQTNSASGITSPASGSPPVVWSANRDKLVKINATLQLTSEGDLILYDANGTLVWNTDTLGRYATGLNLTDTGNLVLHDAKNSVVWQSFDHPTDTLVPGQKLVFGQKLTASVSITNWSYGGLYSLSVTDEGMFAYVESNPPEVYYERSLGGVKANKEPSYLKFMNGSIALYINSSEPSNPDISIPIPQASEAQYMRLESDGHLRLYEWAFSWQQVADILTGNLGDCNYPMVCGRNGVCSSNGNCSCPGSANASSYFRVVNYSQPNFGCSEVNSLSCNASESHSFLDLDDMTYFSFRTDISNTNMNRCKEACLVNCSCKAAIFRYGSDPSTGDCFLPSDIFSIMNNVKDKTYYNSSVSMKVQLSPNASPSVANSAPSKSRVPMIIGSTVGTFFLVVILIAVIVFKFWKKKDGEVEENYLDSVPGMPTRFSFEELKIATQNFSMKLGEGGFGLVFQGSLKDGTKVAVKCLDGIGQVKMSFLAEVETVGSIHHVNLVRLVGFCAEKSHRLLVFEYMVNGSLDKWIYKINREFSLDWKCRRKIVLDIAKGLAYLHEECRQKIIHLDIKPQNILLDENLNAKLSDFGLSKLIPRDQIQVVTRMRGTPGYLAPEWLSSFITEKVDVYSFGIVILEILCGRKNFDQSETEERMHLLSLFKRKAEEGDLLDMIDKYSEDMQSNKTEVVHMMKVASWCLQSDYANRPSMSVVVKVLEGLVDVDINANFSGLLNPQFPVTAAPNVRFEDTAPLFASVLSGPR